MRLFHKINDKAGACYFEDIPKIIDNIKKSNISKLYCLLGWTKYSDKHYEQCKDILSLIPLKLEITILCNTAKEQDFFETKLPFIRTLQINQNCFLNPCLYKKCTNSCNDRKYTAISIARITPFKKLERIIDKDYMRVLFIGDYSKSEKGYAMRFIRLARSLGHDHIKKVKNKDLHKYFHQSIHYVIASDEEGANFAQAEAILSGLRVYDLAENPLGRKLMTIRELNDDFSKFIRELENIGIKEFSLPHKLGLKVSYLSYWINIIRTKFAKL